jgi:hypothetical protein
MVVILTIQNTQTDDIKTIEVDEDVDIEGIKLMICAETGIDTD